MILFYDGANGLILAMPLTAQPTGWGYGMGGMQQTGYGFQR